MIFDEGEDMGRKFKLLSAREFKLK